MKSTLLFKEKLKIEIGEHWNGYLEFESPEYFIHRDARGDSLEDMLRKSITKGSIYFTCELQ